MGVAPVVQIGRMLREHSSRDVSLGYFMILLAGFALWISYGIAARNIALVIPNTVVLLVGIALVTVALRLRHQPAGNACVRTGRHKGQQRT
jgi:MtN3 and saliva related transmembrane protein